MTPPTMVRYKFGVSFLRSEIFSYIITILAVIMIGYKLTNYEKMLRIKEEENKITTDTRIIAELLAKIGVILFIGIAFCADRLHEIYQLLKN